MNNLIAFFEIPAADFHRAIAFYEKSLDCKLSLLKSPGEKMAFFPADDGRCPGAISFAPGFRPSSDGILISLNIDNMESVLSRIVELGGHITTPRTKIEAEGRGYFSVFLDSEGNKVGLYSEQ